MRIPEEPVYIDLFQKNPVFTSLHLKSHVHVVPPLAKFFPFFQPGTGLLGSEVEQLARLVVQAWLLSIRQLAVIQTI